LRSEIVTAARDLLAETGSADRVSMRAVAQRVGVTSPSIYLHFADKDALLYAVVADVFTELDLAIQKAVADLGPRDPLSILQAQGLAYIRFALAHPEHYRIATMEPCPVAPSVDEVLASGAFAHLMAAVLDCMAAGIFADGDPLPVALDLWAAGHGIASLMIAKPYLPWGDVETVGKRVLCTAAAGHIVADLIGGDVTTADVATWQAAQRRP
jgi:AcrR family transcriptional regulator